MTPPELRARTRKFALEISRFCETLPGDARTQEIANQLHDSAQSVASNYRAACRAQTGKVFFAKLCVVLEEIDEAEGWLDVLIETRKASGQHVTKLHGEAGELVKIFSASKRTWLLNHPDSGPKK
jgi:four helix bundle protein